MLLEAIRSQSRFEQVAQQISKLINKGKLKTGMRLPSLNGLAKQLDVSLSKIREVMIALEMQEWLKCVWIPEFTFYTLQNKKRR